MDTVIRFENVSFSFGHNKTILDEVKFSVRRGMKIALMGQNGAGKTTLFKLLTQVLGAIVDEGMMIATAYKQVSA